MIEVTNSFDWLCNVCIDLMTRASKYSGLSYCKHTHLCHSGAIVHDSVFRVFCRGKNNDRR